jgi:hypothetical protein
LPKSKEFWGSPVQICLFIWGVICLREFRYLGRLNQEPGIFLGSGSFLVAWKWVSKELSCLLGSERLERLTKLKLCRELSSFISRIRNFIQLIWSIGWTLILIFLGQVQKSQTPEDLFSWPTHDNLYLSKYDIDWKLK